MLSGIVSADRAANKRFAAADRKTWQFFLNPHATHTGGGTEKNLRSAKKI